MIGRGFFYGVVDIELQKNQPLRTLCSQWLIVLLAVLFRLWLKVFLRTLRGCGRFVNNGQISWLRLLQKTSQCL